eukprot:jgi/Mesen1/8934/ME000551S08412
MGECALEGRSWSSEKSVASIKRLQSTSATPEKQIAPPFVNTDLTAVRSEYLMQPPSFIAKWLISQLKDKRDAPVAYLMFNICTTSVPVAVGMYLWGNIPHVLGFLYLLGNSALFLQRFILCLHCVEHSQPFREDTWAGWVFSQLCSNVLCTMYGIPPGVYRLHHIVMHHCENNLFPYDVSSTEPYQRNNFIHFLGYWIRFWAAIHFELPYYALRRERPLLALKFFGAVGRYLYVCSPVATIWVLIVPFFVSSLAMMFGNWSQHIFIDPARPRNNYCLTYNLVNSVDNTKTFNDGYHIIHHTNSKLHWTQLPVRFMETLEKHGQEDAIVFEGLSVFDVGFFVFTGQLDILADRYVNIGQKKRSKGELIEMFLSRLQPI